MNYIPVVLHGNWGGKNGICGLAMKCWMVHLSFSSDSTVCEKRVDLLHPENKGRVQRIGFHSI
jgi:hypothetical protein